MPPLRGGQIIRLPTLPTKSGSVVGREFLTESRFSLVGGSVVLLTDLLNRTEPTINQPFNRTVENETASFH
jgi:hypothetical protein